MIDISQRYGETNADFERRRAAYIENHRRKRKKYIKIGLAYLLGTSGIITGITIGLSTFYTVDEGHIGIQKHFKKAVKQVEPGLHFKIPFVDSVSVIDVRTRRSEEQMSSATSEQMPITLGISTNWTVHRAATLELYQKYGSLEQFESRILDPRFRAIAKDITPKYSAEQIIQNRSIATQKIEDLLKEEMTEYPIEVNNVQIENIVLPPKYISSIEIKQTEKNLAEAEKT